MKLAWSAENAKGVYSGQEFQEMRLRDPSDRRKANRQLTSLYLVVGMEWPSTFEP